MSNTYYIYSWTVGQDNGPNVGIWLMYQQQQQQDMQGQPVRSDADLVEWKASRDIQGGGPAYLAPSPYTYTIEREREVFATDVSEVAPGKEWFLIPGDGEDNYVIATTEEQKYVWTAVGLGKTIKIEEFRAGDNSQVFKIVPTKQNV